MAALSPAEAIWPIDHDQVVAAQRGEELPRAELPTRVRVDHAAGHFGAADLATADARAFTAIVVDLMRSLME
jgi:hypothetical protein